MTLVIKLAHGRLRNMVEFHTRNRQAELAPQGRVSHDFMPVEWTGSPEQDTPGLSET